MPYVNIGAMQVYYEAAGDPAAPPLVLLHGGLGTAGANPGGWGLLAPVFAERYHVISVEHRGHGHTNNPDGTFSYDMLCADLAACIEALGIGPVHVAGMSDGGIVALGLGMTRPDLARALVPLGANYRVDDTIREAVLMDLDAFERDYPEVAAQMAEAHDVAMYPGHWKDLWRMVMDNALTNPAWTETDLQRIPNPTLLMAGEHDPFANLTQMVGMKQNIPNAEWFILNNAGHSIQHTHPEIVGPRILDFLGRHD
jgi:pimeloyl-ACP methyl ester carboxylesterase